MRRCSGDGSCWLLRTFEQPVKIILPVGWADRRCVSSTLASLTRTEPLADLDSRAPWTKRLIHWAVSARAHRIICLVLGIWMLNAFDLAFTILSHEQGLLHEENPLARQMLSNGMASIILFKLGMVLIGSYPLLRFRTARIAELAAYLVFAAYVLLAIRWSMCYELYASVVPDHMDLADIERIHTVTH